MQFLLAQFLLAAGATLLLPMQFLLVAGDTLSACRTNSAISSLIPSQVGMGTMLNRSLARLCGPHANFTECFREAVIRLKSHLGRMEQSALNGELGRAKNMMRSSLMLGRAISSKASFAGEAGGQIAGQGNV